MDDRETPPWTERMVRLLDDGARVPGTEIRFGLDAIVGALIPGAGDVLSGSGSLSLLVVAWREGVPTRGLARMLMTITVDTLFGSVPVLGDVFDLFYKANRRNLELIERFREEPETKTRTATDYVLVTAAVLLVGLAIAIPFITIALGLSLFNTETTTP